jgi:hypothetical protein
LSLDGSDRYSGQDWTPWRTINDLRRNAVTEPISVVTIGEGKLLEAAERIYGGLHASVVREPDIDRWADQMAVDVAPALH